MGEITKVENVKVAGLHSGSVAEAEWRLETDLLVVSCSRPVLKSHKTEQAPVHKNFKIYLLTNISHLLTSATVIRFLKLFTSLEKNIILKDSMQN